MKKRVTSLFLTLLILLGTVSCQSGDEIPGVTSTPDLTTPEETEKEMTEMTISDREAPDKVLTLCENGETGYRILYPFGGTYEKEAAEKLASALKAVTGCEFPVVADIWIKENETKVILIGSTASEKTSLLSSSLPELEYAIRVSDESLLIFGKSPKITAFAVDSFLESRLGYKTPSRHESAQVLKIDADFSISGSWLESVKGGNSSPTKAITTAIPVRRESFRTAEKQVPPVSPKETPLLSINLPTVQVEDSSSQNSSQKGFPAHRRERNTLLFPP